MNLQPKAETVARVWENGSSLIKQSLKSNRKADLKLIRMINYTFEQRSDVPSTRRSSESYLPQAHLVVS